MDLALASAASTISIAPSWQEMTPLVLFPGIGMLLVALAFVVYAWRRRLGFRYVAWGSLAWVISVALKFAWAIGLNNRIYVMLTSLFPTSLGSLVFDLYVGSLTGLFEVALVYLVLSRLRLGQAVWKQALAFGIGFGAVEAILLGASSLASGLVVLLAPGQVPASAAAQFALASNPLYGAAPIVERAATIFVHILSAGLIFYAIRTGDRRWLWTAVVYKTALDSVAAFAQFWGVNTIGRIWTVEAIVIVFGLIGWWGTLRIARRYSALPPVSPLDPGPATAPTG
jgi:uncharacterized membrane protein YhfC